MRAVELAKPKGFGWQGCKAWLIDQRGDCTADDVPIAKRNWNYRLDVEHISRGVMVWADPTINIVLKRQADHRSYRVLCGLGKILCRLLGEGGGNSRQHEHDREPESRPESRARHFSVRLASRPRTANVSV